MVEKTAKRPRKAKLGVYLYPSMARELKLLKAQTDKPVCVLIEEAVSRQYGIALPSTSPEPS